MEKEEWRWVSGYEGRYKVSSHGRVKSFLFSRDGRLMKFDYGGNGYARVHFQWKKTFIVHRLVAQAFIPNPLNLPTVNHRDGVKVNNYVGNLEWATYSDNMRHSWTDLQSYRNRVAKSPRGEANKSAKLTTADVLEIRRTYVKDQMGTHRLAKKYGVSKPAIRAILRRKTWAHV